MIEQRVTLRYGAQQIPAIVQAVQGDTGRDVIFELADYEIPAGATANYYIDKPDGNAVYNSAEVISSTEILAHLTEQALAVPGRNNGQVRILSDGEVITSFDFMLEVMAFRGILQMQSETEVNIFDEALQAAAEDAIEEIQAQTPVVTGMQNSIAPSYSNTKTYNVGDYVMYNAQLYMCRIPITTAEVWTSAHWTQIPLSDAVSDLKTTLCQEVNLAHLSIDNWVGPGITISKNSDGTYTVNGTATGNASCFIGETQELTGDFKITGCPAGGAGSTYSIQVQENGSWKYSEVGNGKSVTLSNARLLLFIVIREGVTVNNLIFKPQVTSNLNATYNDFYKEGVYLPDYEEVKDKARKAYQYSVIVPLAGTEDLDDIIDAGTYYGSGSFLHAPLTTMDAMRLEVYDNGVSSYRLQVITVYLDNKYAVYTRYRFGSTPTWSAWTEGISKEKYNTIKNAVENVWNCTFIAENNDLDDYITSGLYRGNSGTYLHSPVENMQRFYMEVLGDSSGSYRIQIITVYEVSCFAIYTRYRSGAVPTWSDWSEGINTAEYSEAINKVNSDYYDVNFEKNSTLLESTDKIFNGNTQNTGHKLRIMNYNVAHYTDDTQYSTLVFLPEEKRHNFKKMLSAIQPDFICLEEDSNYIDGAANVSGSLNTKPSIPYIYNPVFPFAYGTDETFIRSKIEALDGGDTLKFQNSGRWIRYALFSINNKNLLLVSTHPTPNYQGYDLETLIAIRKSEYQQLMAWVYKEIMLISYATNLPVECPSWDYCIICGDMNCSTSEDKENLLDVLDERGFSTANGGWMGWLETVHNSTSSNAIDVIACSQNIVINGISSYKSLYDSLYSDHYPLVADVTLL